MLFIRVGEDVGALECLWEEAEDVVNDENAAFSVFRTGGVWKLVSDDSSTLEVP